MTVFSGCASMYNYSVSPTPIEKNKSKYVLRNFVLKLENSIYKQNDKNETFKSQSELEESFRLFIEKELSTKMMLDNKNGFLVDIEMLFKRIFFVGGNALSKAQFSYIVKAYNKNDELLADFEVSNSTVNYGYLKDKLVTMQMAAFSWNAKNEPQEIELISRTLVEELAKMGK